MSEFIKSIFESLDWSKDNEWFCESIRYLTQMYSIEIAQEEKIRKETAREILSRLHCYGDRDEALRRDLLNIADDYDVEVDSEES